MRQDLLYNYFYNCAFQLNSPVSVMIELLTQCNLRCEHCYLPDHSNHGIPFNRIKSLFHELKDLGVVNVSLTGGEIFLREDLLDIVALARGLHMRVFILSNGTLLDRDIAVELSKMHISEFSTTIFSMNEDIHDSITKTKGSLTILLQNLNYLKDNNLRVRIKTPIMTKNSTSFREIKKYSDLNGFQYLTSPLIFSKNNGDTSPKEMRILDKDLSEIMIEIDAINRNDHLHNKSVPCAALKYSFAIDCNGDVYPCNSFFYKVGNIYESSIKEIWYESDDYNFIRNIKKTDLKDCINCEYDKYCDRCPGMVYMEKHDMFSCDEFAKSIAKIRYSNSKLDI